MELEVGKYYRTRGGHKAFVDGRRLPCPFTGKPPQYEFAGCIDGVTDYASWCANGRYDIGECELDLVAKWVEPVTQKYEVVLVRHCNGEIRRYIGEVGQNWAGKVIARKVEIITEGEGI